MILDGLKPLYADMRKNNLERCKFKFVYNKVEFEVLYFIDCIPNKLSFGVLEKNFYFEKEVKKGFEITEYIEEYLKLCEILELKFSKDGKFKPFYFFELLNRKIPHNVDSTKKYLPSDGIRHDTRNNEDKIYFFGWLDNKHVNQKVSEENLQKTKAYLGVEAYTMCKRNNISSRWTAKNGDRKDYFLWGSD
ncbi:MAG: DUF6037 family protein [Tissierellales bacterium]|jgi:hypothetical protein|nr:DUF6037 family protein [Tissierellales bacterium]